MGRWRGALHGGAGAWRAAADRIRQILICGYSTARTGSLPLPRSAALSAESKASVSVASR